MRRWSAVIAKLLSHTTRHSHRKRRSLVLFPIKKPRPIPADLRHRMPRWIGDQQRLFTGVQILYPDVPVSGSRGDEGQSLSIARHRGITLERNALREGLRFA